GKKEREERFLSAQADTFAGANVKKKRRLAPFEMTARAWGEACSKAEDDALIGVATTDPKADPSQWRNRKMLAGRGGQFRAALLHQLDELRLLLQPQCLKLFAETNEHPRHPALQRFQKLRNR